jgi:hypothetical protein
MKQRFSIPGASWVMETVRRVISKAGATSRILSMEDIRPVGDGTLGGGGVLDLVIGVDSLDAVMLTGLKQDLFTFFWFLFFPYFS